MKDLAKLILQKLFGFSNYLFVFSVFKIKTLKHDKHERDFLHFLKLIPDGTTIFDIGANIGIMSVYLARNFSSSQLFAFEPMPDNIKALKRVLNYFGLKNVTIVECALGTENGQLQMVMPVRNKVRFQGLSHAVHESITENNEGERFTVPLKKLDDMPQFKNMNQPLGAIKIDVENFEYFVLKGGEELLRTYKPIVYAELWDNENRQNCFELMKDVGYKIKILDGDKLIELDAKIHSKENFFFVC